jgi:hypothetical protein
MIQLKVYKNTTRTEQFWLDLYDSEPIKLTLSIEDITNADATSTYSKAFKVPGTRVNNEFFQQAFEINGVLFDVTVKKPAVILVDGAEFRQGHVRLNKMIKNTELDRYDYELVFLGETRDFSSIIGDSQLCQLNMPDLIGGPSGTPLNREDVINSWQAFPQNASLTAGLHDGDIIYPLVDHGNTYADTGMPLQSEVRTTVGPLSKPFTSSSHPLALNQMKPMIRAKRIWDQIFTNAGYTYSSSFIDSARFHQMYVSAFGNVAEPAYDAASASEYNFSAANLANNGQQQGAGVQSATDVEVDPSNAWNGIQYVAPATGTYTFTGSTYFWGYNEIQSSWPPAFDPVYGVLQVHVNGVSVASGNYANNETSNVTWTGNLSTGDIVTFFMATNDNVTFIAAINQSFACTNSPGNINPASLLECTYKQIDFIKDILLMFRLVLSPDANNPRNFIVEPWQTYINSGQLYDWSSKLVEEKDVVVEPVFFTQSDQITFTQPTDGDWINIYQMQSYKHNWGWLQFDSGNDLLKGSREIKVSGIANTPFTQIEGQPSTSSWIAPQLHVHGTDDGPARHLPIKAKTRLLFYNGLKTTPENWYLVDTTPVANYPLVSQYEAWPITPSSLNLGFSNDIQYWGDDITSANYNLNGTTLYDSYWSRYINSLYNKYSRRVTAYFVLNNIDLNTFSFDDTIFVNGVYYIPEKIIDVQIGAYTEVQVQLLTANDFVPTWSNETLFATVEGVNTECLGSLGQINVECGGAGPITWSLSNGQTGQFNNYSPPPYSFSITNVPVGTWSLTLTDQLGRTVILPVTVPLGSSPTATSTHTNATPGLCDGSIVVTPSMGPGTTIFWSDQYPMAGTFTRNNLCCGPYSYFIRDTNGCTSPSYLVQVECPPPKFIYEAHEYGKLCNTLSGTEVIVECSVPLPINDGTVYGLNNVPGCFAIIATSTLTPVATVISTYPSCEVCKEPIPIENYKDWYFFNSGGNNYPVNTTGGFITSENPAFFLNTSFYDPDTGYYTTTASVTEAILDTLSHLGDNPGAYGGVNLDYLDGFTWNNPTKSPSNPSPTTRTNPTALVGSSINYIIVKQSLFASHFTAQGNAWNGPYIYDQSGNSSFGSNLWDDRKELILEGVNYYIVKQIGMTMTENDSTSQYLSYKTPFLPKAYNYYFGTFVGNNNTSCVEFDVITDKFITSDTPIAYGTTIKIDSSETSSPINDDLCYWIYDVAVSDLYENRACYLVDEYTTCAECIGIPTPTPGPTPTPPPPTPTPSPTPLPITTYYYEVEPCGGGISIAIQSDFELSFGDVYGFAELVGCYTIVGEISNPGGTPPTPNVAYINCAVCYGEPAGSFLTDRKPRGGFPESLCANNHTIPIYNGDVVDAADLQVGMTMWSDASQSIPWNGATLWYSISNGDTHTTPEVSALINSVGMIKEINICSGGTCQIWTHGGYDIGECLYLDCDGLEQISYYNGPAASGFDQSSFCATKILSYTGSEPYQTLELC